MFGVKSEREGLLRCLQKFLPSDLLHEDDGLSRYICRSCELKISAFLNKEQELKTLFLATESGNRAACERECFKRGRGTVENSMNTLNIDRSPGLPEKKSTPATKSPSGTRIKRAPKFNYRSSSSRIDLMSRLSRLAFIKPAPPASLLSKNICRLAPKFNTPLTTPPIIESSSYQDNSTNSTNTNVSCASYCKQTLKKKRVLPAVLKKRAGTDLEKGADILSDVLKKVNDCTVILYHYILHSCSYASFLYHVHKIILAIGPFHLMSTPSLWMRSQIF